VEQEEASILQTKTRPFKRDMATMHASALLKWQPCDVTLLDRKLSQ